MFPFTRYHTLTCACPRSVNIVSSFKLEKPISSILIKPAGPDCNMACDYCFYLGKSSMFPDTKTASAETHRMSDGILDALIRQVMEGSGREISFGWQGGEPTLMGLDFFRKAVQLQSKLGKGKLVGNGMQTNGLVFDLKWAQFLARHKFLVGLSIDGPEHIHDHYRHMLGSKGSWASVNDRAKLLLDEGVAVNALTVVNDYSVRFPDEIYEFHKGIGLTHMQFIPCLEPDSGTTSIPAPFSVKPVKLGKFLCTLFDLWLKDFVDGIPSTSIRFFDSVFYHYVGMTPPECTLLKECGVYVVVEHNGDVYSCDFYVDPEWKLGNVMEDSLTELLNSERQTVFGRAKSKLSRECEKCKWLTYCRGGCPRERGYNAKDKKLSYLCPAYKMFFEHADPHFKKLAKKWKSEQRGRI